MPDVKLPPAPSAPPPAPLAALSESERIEELRRRVKVLRDGSLFNRGSIANPDRNKQYCWVNVREERQVFFQARGWDLCTDPNIQTKYWKPDEHRHRRADLVLYEMPFELWQAFEAQKHLDGLNLTGKEAQARFASDLERSGVRPYIPRVS
jgi:hypothetical protein